ncbi:MAG: nitrite/sulfite reductase [Candidatus Omnitrophica bacterium]|nr:nitrite/sulfite reductase [Candidatus Omnitrophota bacterium]
MKKPFEPNFHTSPEDFSKEETNKLNAAKGEQTVYEDFRDHAADIKWETEQLAKSFGIYLEFNRAKTGQEKDWMYMIRIANPGGGPVSREQWNLLNELSDKYTTNPEGLPSIRLTTRQTFQFHWVSKQGVLDIVKSIGEKGLLSLNGCGDNTRNTMACPCSKDSDIFDGNQLADEIGLYFQLPLAPFIKVFAIDPKYVRQPEQSFKYAPNLLNRKFKIAVTALHKDPESGNVLPDNCVEAMTNDMAIVPLYENGAVSRFQIYVGGGQGERNGKPSMASLAKPLGITTRKNLFAAMDAVVSVHQEWGDRQNRHWARLKYVIKKQGIAWFRDKVNERLETKLEQPVEDYDYGNRELHFGWAKQPNGLFRFGMFVENGRVIDNSPNGNIKSLVSALMNQCPVRLMVTPNQDLVFTDIPVDAKDAFEKILKDFHYGSRDGRPYSLLRMNSGACVGRDTCRLTYTDSEKFEPELMDELEKLGWGNMAESIGITGCERQCFRPATKAIGLVGSGLNRYQFKLFGDITGRFQGQALVDSCGENMYLRSVPREDVAKVIDILFKDFSQNTNGKESLGGYHRRVGADAIIQMLKSHSALAELLDKPFNTSCVIE